MKLRRGRHLVLIDIENIVGTANPSLPEVCAAIQGLRQALVGFDSAQKVWACSHGADLALLGVLDTEHIEDRYERVTVCSGDGIFAESVARLAGHGIAVGVAGIAGRISARLRLAAHEVTDLHGAHLALGTAS
jgi:hypothetical protein